MNPIHELPAGYEEVRYVLLTEEKLLIRLNLLAVIPLVAAIPLMGWWWAVASWGRDASGETGIVWWIALILIFVIVLPLHELIHGITIMLLGHRARYGAKLSKGVLYATAEHALFRRNEYLAVALAPLIVITLLAMGLMLVAQSGMGVLRRHRGGAQRGRRHRRPVGSGGGRALPGDRAHFRRSRRIPGFRSGGKRAPCGRSGRHCREFDPEDRAATFALIDADAAALQFGQRLDDPQAQAGAALAPGRADAQFREHRE